MTALSILNRSALTLVTLLCTYFATVHPITRVSASSTAHVILSLGYSLCVIANLHRIWFPTKWVGMSVAVTGIFDALSFCLFILCLCV